MPDLIEDSPIVSESSIPRAYLNSTSLKYLEDIQKEKALLGGQFPLTSVLIDQAIDKVHTNGRIPGKDNHCDVSKPVPMKLTQRVYVPVKNYPTFNFPGKILGPKGNTIRRLQQKTQCKIVLKGRNSMRDSFKEEELRNSDDPKYAHLHKNLFIEISTVGVPVVCYNRLAFALTEIREYLIPDKNDQISKEQLKELNQGSDLASVQSSRNIPGPLKSEMRNAMHNCESEDNSAPPPPPPAWKLNQSVKAEPMETDVNVPMNMKIAKNNSLEAPSNLQPKGRVLRGPKLKRLSLEQTSAPKRVCGSTLH